MNHPERAGHPGPLAAYGRCASLEPTTRVRCQLTHGHPDQHRHWNGRFRRQWTTTPATTPNRSTPRG